MVAISGSQEGSLDVFFHSLFSLVGGVVCQVLDKAPEMEVGSVKVSCACIQPKYAIVGGWVFVFASRRLLGLLYWFWCRGRSVKVSHRGGVRVTVRVNRRPLRIT